MSWGKNQPVPVWVHPSRWAEAVAGKRREALCAGAIPHTFHYEGWRQSQLWQEVARRYQPAGLEGFYRGVFAELRQAGLPRPPFHHLVGLGAGGARKERWFLESLGSREALHFTPVDVSASLALESALCVEDLVTAPVRPLVADLEVLADLSGWLSEADGGARSRWFTAFGLTPNSEPGVLLPRLRDFLREGDRLLLSANLLPDGRIEGVRGEYDNPETRRWLRQVLVDWGLDERLGEIAFRAGTMNGVDALVAWVQWKEDVDLDWDGRPFRARCGEGLRLFFSIRYTLAGFVQTLNQHGLAVERTWESDCGGEGLCLTVRG